jgi:hypothetical protein
MFHSVTERKRSRIPGLVDPDVKGFLLGNEVPNLIFWFRAGSLDYLSDGDLVNYWEDESGNGNHAAQGFSALKPIYKVSIVNGHPVVRFSGATNFHTVEIDENLATWFIVWSRLGAGNNDVVLGDSNTTYSYLQYGGTWHVYTGASIVVAMGAGTFFLKCCVYDNVNYQRYTNGGAEAGQAGIGDMQFRYIGPQTGGALSGDIAEIAIFDTDLSNANRQIVENYINTKYALW